MGNPEAGMPAFAAQLTDRQVAAIATFIRNSWGNEHGMVDPAVVTALRAGLGVN
jgi:mono/diheme cytochrome c family protein